MQALEIYMENKMANNEKALKIFIDKLKSNYNGDFGFLGRDGVSIETEIKTKKDSYRFWNNKNGASFNVTFGPHLLNKIGVSSGVSNVVGNEKNFFDIIELSIAAMKAADSEFFIGNLDMYSTTPQDNIAIRIFFFEDDKYLPFLRENINAVYKFDIEPEKLKNMVERYAVLIKEYGKYKLVCLDCIWGSGRASDSPGKLYEEIKKMRDAKK